MVSDPDEAPEGESAADGTKKRLKAFIIRWEMPFYVVTAVLYAVAIAATLLLVPKISNNAIAVLLLFSGLTATVGAMASALKADDTTE